MKNILNFILFQSLWLCCIFGAAHSVIWPASVIVLVMILQQLNPNFRHKNDGAFLYTCIILGFIMDSLLAYFGLIDYYYDLGFSYIAPFWIVFLWTGFALTLNHSMLWLLKKPRIGTLFIIIGAPLSYYTADKLKAIHINESVLTLSLISVMWLMVYHILLALNGLLNQESSRLRHV